MHVQLLMTMKLCQPRIVRHKIHFLVTANSQNLNWSRNPYPNAPDGVGAPVTYPFLSIARKCIGVYTLFLQISGAQPFPK